MLDIELYFNIRVEEWLNSLDIDEATDASLKRLLQGVPEKAEGIPLSLQWSFC